MAQKIVDYLESIIRQSDVYADAKNLGPAARAVLYDSALICIRQTARAAIQQLENERVGIIPRRPFDDDKPQGLLESDKDFVLNNIDAAVAPLETQ